MSAPFLTRDPLDPGALLAEVAGPDRGGTALFVGAVRNHHGGRAVVRLAYSAYEPMAEGEAARIVEEAEAKWPVRLRMRHRLGDLEVGEAAVVVAVAGAHREEAFAACRWAIETIKARVPIWKQEHHADGTSSWVSPAEAHVPR